ncbi:MAG TPA: nucleoside deaminase, partial [Isosphaeraceae bacterium]|nr:nucleoside deaminase [Isosphaeraceae bacterium]
MSMHQIGFRSRLGRISAGLILGLVLGFAGLGIAHVWAPARVLGFLQVPSDKPALAAEQIMARFPMYRHEEFMRRAIANSRKAGVEYKTGGAFGAVIVDRDGNVIADGLNHVVAQNDPTWHAEMHAIRQACALLKKPKLDGCILYTSSEPCPMCLATSYWAALDGIVFGAEVSDSKKYGNFDDDFIYAQFTKPTKDRSIPEYSLLRPEAVAVW